MCSSQIFCEQAALRTLIGYLSNFVGMTALMVLVGSSLFILIGILMCSGSSVSIHLLCVREFVRLTYQTLHASHIIATQGQLYILIGDF